MFKKFPPITLLLISLLALFALPSIASAHIGNPDDGSIYPISQRQKTGRYAVEVWQYANADLLALEVHVYPQQGSLPADTTLTLVAHSADSDTPYTVDLVRSEDDFFGLLPLIGEDWQVEVLIAGEMGEGSADLLVKPYRAPVESPPWVKNLTFAAPFILIALAFIALKGFGVQVFGNPAPKPKALLG